MVQSRKVAAERKGRGGVSLRAAGDEASWVIYSQGSASSPVVSIPTNQEQR